MYIVMIDEFNYASSN